MDLFFLYGLYVNPILKFIPINLQFLEHLTEFMNKIGKNRKYNNTADIQIEPYLLSIEKLIILKEIIIDIELDYCEKHINYDQIANSFLCLLVVVSLC